MAKLRVQHGKLRDSTGEVIMEESYMCGDLWREEGDRLHDRDYERMTVAQIEMKHYFYSFVCQPPRLSYHSCTQYVCDLTRSDAVSNVHIEAGFGRRFRYGICSKPQGCAVGLSSSVMGPERLSSVPNVAVAQPHCQPHCTA